MRVVGYYTKDTPYEQDAKVLRLSLDAYGITHHIGAIDDLGSWQANTAFKPYFLREVANLYNEPLLYIDVDAFVLGPLDYFDDLPYSFAACLFGNELLSGTVYFRNDDETVRLLELWIDLVERFPERLPDGRPAWDQRTMKMAVAECSAANQGAYGTLPHEYAYIVGMTPLQYPDCGPPVIVHTRGRFRHHPGV